MAGKEKFVITGLFYDRKAKSADGLGLVTETMQKDMALITGEKMPVCEKLPLTGGVIIGVVGDCSYIDHMIREGKLDVSPIEGKREVFMQTRIDDNLIIVGSEKISAIHGAFELLEDIGISPWVYWADVKPKKRKTIVVPSDKLEKVSKEPSVRFRGFFMNDEWPSLGRYVMNTFGDFNAKFYRKVFELLLRLKGNYFWPAMWSASFFIEGGDGNDLGNMDLAKSYGIHIGTSHHEPLTRASEEWDKVKSTDNAVGYGKDWNYYTNARGLHKYWEDGIERGKDYDNVITIGMRGERDTSMLGDNSSVQENVDLLKKIISDQKDIIENKGLKDAPLMLALYKEVEEYFYGSEQAEGLCKWDALDNVTLLLSDDNFGNVRTLPTKETRDRKAGWGLYYHFDYHGGPRSWEWVNSTALQKTWEQVSMAYDYGIKDIWIVNVGDLRPMELPLSYFMNLAYDFESYGTANRNNACDYYEKFAKEQFGEYVNHRMVKQIATVLEEYCRMHANSKPEATNSHTYHPSHYNEAKRMLSTIFMLENKTQKLWEAMPKQCRDSFYGLVYYPAMAGANVQKMNIYAGLNEWYAQSNSLIANDYKALVETCIARDKELTKYYNKKMAKGKWDGMMSSAHTCFENWNDEGWHYPRTMKVYSINEGYMSVYPENCDYAIPQYKSGKLDEFTSLNKKQKRTITLTNSSHKAYDYEIEAPEFVHLSSYQGKVKKVKEITVEIDWSKVTTDISGDIVIKATMRTVPIHVEVRNITVNENLPNTVYMQADCLVLEMADVAKKTASQGVEFKKLHRYGKSNNAIKMYPTTVNFEQPENAPTVSFDINVPKDDTYFVRAYFAPTNNLENGRNVGYAVAIDDEKPVTVQTLGSDYVAGDSYEWAKGVILNGHEAQSEHKISLGNHQLKFYGLDAGLVLQKIVISRDEVKESYFGPIK